MQIQLHSQNDVPAVADVGFSVAPGFHALVTIGYSEVSAYCDYKAKFVLQTTYFLSK